MDNTIGGRIRAIRKKLRMTQSEFAEVLGVSNTSVSTYETGEHAPPVALLSRIATAGGVSLDWLVAGSGVTADEMEIVAAYRRMDATRQERFRDIANDFVTAAGKKEDRTG